MHILLNVTGFIVAYIWGDWKNWKKYYPTYLFFIGGDLFFNLISYNYRLWEYKETLAFSNLLDGHLVISLFIMAVGYSSTILIYLGNFPTQRYKQFLWILLWILLFSFMEFINKHYFDIIEHHHGWSVYWSLLFNIVMFPVLKIHEEHPFLAWIISILFFIFLYNQFDFPKDSFL
ncbi:MAG: CBO0543 family protein [Bacillus sp. (in: firmicutes)]